jgi:hypothetical protein
VGTTQFRGYPRIDPLTQPDGKGQINALADAVDADVALLGSGYRLAAILQFTSSGTFSKGSYAGIKAVEVEVIGAGGGSGFAAATNGSQIAFGRGGAGGAYGHGFILASALASAETVTVGAGGAGGTSGTPDGTAGGSSSFGAFVTAGGGDGGNDATASTAGTGTSFLRGSGGTAGGTAIDISVPGEGDGSVDYAAGKFLELTGLMGGAAGGPYGVAAHNISGVNLVGIVTQTPLAGRGIGGGARGPANGVSLSSQNGAAGANGRVIVRVYV